MFALLSACPGLTHCFRRDSLTFFRQCMGGVGKQRERGRRSLTVCLGGKRENLPGAARATVGVGNVNTEI